MLVKIPGSGYITRRYTSYADVNTLAALLQGFPALTFLIYKSTEVDDMWLKKVLNSQFLHRMGLLFTLIAAVSWAGAWLAGDTGRFWGFTQNRLYMDTICFLLVAAGLRIGCLMHHLEEHMGIRPNPYGYKIDPPIDKVTMPPI